MNTPLHHRHREQKPELTYYVSGPMRGIPSYNFPMFDSCAAWLRSEGYGAINPADHDREIDPDCELGPDFASGNTDLKTHPDMGFTQLLGWDLQQISSDACTGIVMLPGWEKGVGSAHERYVAEACGKQVWLAHYTGTTAAYHDPTRSPKGQDSLEYHGWYMTLCEDRLLSSFTAEGLREALKPMSGPEIRQALSPTIHDPNREMDRERLKARGWVEREPDTFVRDIAAVRDGNTFTHPTDMGAGGQVSRVYATPYRSRGATREEGLQHHINELQGEAFHDPELEALLGGEVRVTPQIGQFQTKDSGVREEFGSGMVRDTQEGKPRYDLIPLSPLKRIAELYARGAQKYGDRNWEKATGAEELERFKASALRHLYQALQGDRDEDHWAGAVFNIFGAMWLEERLCAGGSVREND